MVKRALCEIRKQIKYGENSEKPTSLHLLRFLAATHNLPLFAADSTILAF